MFLALIFIVIGLLLLLNAFGIVISSNFWGLFWAVVFLAIGIKLLVRRGKCPMCGWAIWKEKINGSCCGHHHNHGQEE